MEFCVSKYEPVVVYIAIGCVYPLLIQPRFVRV